MSKVNILFVCGYGVGSSAMSAMIVDRNLKESGLQYEFKHTALGEMQSYSSWMNILAISKKLAEGLEFSGKEPYKVIEVVNVMDGKGIAMQILEIAKQHFPEALGSE